MLKPKNQVSLNPQIVIRMYPAKFCIKGLLLPVFTLFSMFAHANDAIRSGIPWFDESFKTVSAHGACIVQDSARFYLFGECKGDSSNAFVGFNCYSSTDLYQWKFEGQVLPQQPSGSLGPNRVGERVKVMKCPKTGEFVMYMHTDNLGYTDPCIGYATSPTINGEYTFRGALLFNGSPIRKWDMGVFQDTDGSGYLLIHHGNIFKLSDDYKSITAQVIKEMSAGESPAIVKKDSVYFWLTSNLTSWERNDNSYYTATSLAGPWSKGGLFAPKGTLTWNSQTTYVIPIYGTQDTTWMFMGDRWSFPCQNAAATYVWQPMKIEGTSLFIPNYNESWKVNPTTGSWYTSKCEMKPIDGNSIRFKGSWTKASSTSNKGVIISDVKGASFTIGFEGTRIGFYGLADSSSGYANVMLQDKKGKTILKTMVDMYCKYPETSLKFLSPVLPKGSYKLTVSVLGMHPVWSNKKGTIFGSIGDFVKLDHLIFEP